LPSALLAFVRSQRTAHGFTSLALAEEHVLALAKLPALHRDDKRHTCGYAAKVKTYTWSTEKNDFLQRERGVSFEDVVLNLQLGNEIDVFEHLRIPRDSTTGSSGIRPLLPA
jgi:hypothetical protein